MCALNIAVCVKPVPDPQHYGKVGIDPVRKTIIRHNIPIIINHMDRNALEAALMLKEANGGVVTLFSMAPSDTEIEIRKLLAMGADEAYLISDREFAGSDTLATSYILNCAIRQIEKQQGKRYDLILCGSESTDGGTCQVPPQLGEWLSLTHLCNAFSIELEEAIEKIFRVKTKTENGFSEWRCKAPIVIGVSRDINTPRFTSVMSVLKAKNKNLTLIQRKNLESLEDRFIGLNGSPTKAGDLFEPDKKRSTNFLNGSIEENVETILRIISSRGITMRT